MIRMFLALIVVVFAQTAPARAVGGTFRSIDGGSLSMESWRGQPVLVVNTASQCAFSGQYAGLQRLYDRFRARGLVVLAVPSDDFNQELDSAAEVKEFCELTYGIDMPMADLTHVRGPDAHPFYKAVKDETGFEPSWNFNKVLIAPDGHVVATWGSGTRPESRNVVKRIEDLLD